MTNINKTAWVCGYLYILSLIRRIVGWNYIGHEASAVIASNLLPQTTIEAIEKILKESSTDFNQTMRSVATWPDTISSNIPTLWTKKFHFALIRDQPPRKCLTYDQKRDCPENNCIVKALANYTLRLKDTQLSTDERALALKFVIHLSGDANCPPHVTNREYLGLHSYGAWQNQLIAIHKIWDTQLLQKRADEFGSIDSYINHLVNQAVKKYQSVRHAKDPSRLDKSAYKDHLEKCFANWVSATNMYVCKSAYKYFHEGVEFSGEYYEKVKTDMDVLLVHAGIRLATVLEFVFNKGRGIC